VDDGPSVTGTQAGPDDEPPTGPPGPETGATGAGATGAGASEADASAAGPSGAEHGPDCDGHPGFGSELRALALAALDRLEPAVHRLRDERPPTPSAPACVGCPVCAVLAVLRGERPEPALRMGEQLSELLAVLRTALEEGDPAGARPDSPPTPDPARSPSGRRVQRIPIERVAP
jgi:hypothetical protein